MTEPTVPTTASRAAPSRDRQQSIVKDALQLFALCGLAIAQPLFDLLGNNPTFLVAHDLSGSALVLFAFELILIPPLVCFAILGLARLVSPAAARVVRTALVGILVALILLPPIHRALGLEVGSWWFLLAVGVGGAAAVLYDRFVGVRTFTTYLAFGPVLFIVLFLVFSPAHLLVTSSDPAAAAVELQGTRTPIVEVVLDEFPLGVLLDAEGRIDAARYPGFARLAGLGTWYPDATSVSPHTYLAVPAILTGRMPTAESRLPVAAANPRSLFTLFGRSHTEHVLEDITQVCPAEICERRQGSGGGAALTEDLGILYAHSELPEDLAGQWLPTINNRWAGFGEDVEDVAAVPRVAGDQELYDHVQGEFRESEATDHVARFQEFIASVTAQQAPGSWFLHVLLPHTPYARLPDGQVYNGSGATPGLDEATEVWANQPELIAVDAQRLVLQTKYVDGLIDQLLDRLQAKGILDDALVVVTADHGQSFIAGKHRRGFPIDDETKHQTMPVPLFIKYPGQQAGEVDRRSAQSVDVLPTIADALGVELPDGWSFDGRSLLGRPTDRPYTVVDEPFGGPARTVPGPIDPLDLQRDIAAFLAPPAAGHDGYRLGPFGNLVGEVAAPLVDGSSTGSVRADSWTGYDGVDPAGVLPALFEADVDGVEPGDWVAVALNGTIAGVGPVYLDEDRGRAIAMLDPSFFRAGANDVLVYRVDPASRRLRPLSSQR